MSEYQQAIREAIFKREKDRVAIYKIAIEVEKIVREQIASEIEVYIDADHEARAFTVAADIARGKR
jgi:hypothetical protein